MVCAQDAATFNRSIAVLPKAHLPTSPDGYQITFMGVAMNMTEVIKHLRAAQPHMKAMGDALDRYSFPDVPQMIVDARQQARRASRIEEAEAIAEFIETASLVECKQIIDKLVGRVSALIGCASELEDASCVLAVEISNDSEGRN